MSEFVSKDLRELAHQLELSPKHRRLSQIRGIEALLALVKPDKSYPYDMVCYRITGYRNRRTRPALAIPGDRLVPDLVALAESITRKTSVAASEIDESYRTYEELAADLQVSTKTIRRWRRHGLMGFRAVCDDGVSRLLYLKSTVDRFVAQNKELVRRGAAFRQLSEAEKTRIVQLAAKLLDGKRIKLHVVARKIADETGRAIETIRYTLRRHDQANPDRALFANNAVPWAPARDRLVWDAFQQGHPVESIARSVGISVRRVERAIRQMRLRHLKAEPVSLIHNELFDAPNADQLILEVPRPPGADSGEFAEAPKDLPPYLRKLYEIKLLTAEQELDAFRRYNYLKYKAARLIESLDVREASQADLDAVGELTAQYEAIRREILRANLRLVVSIAKKHVGWSPRFFEVVSDGNMSLLRAVEKFDYARGFKFSTYASWAIMKNFARTIPEERYHFSRYVTGQDELLASAADHREAEASVHDAQGLADALRRGMDQLTARERLIVTSHYGLFGTGPSMTLEDLGRRFGVTKERIRQIERRAIGKMREVLSPAVADMLAD